VQSDGAPGAPESPAERAAALLVDLAPLVMRVMRRELSAHQGLDLSVPQFRALRFVAKRPSGSLSGLAEHLGTSLPAASKLVERLVELGLVARAADPGDRRQVALSLTAGGEGAIGAAHAAAQRRLAERLAALPPDQAAACAEALALLRELFGGAPTA
jgi:DNA-binding MarR family transcriptional regulator